MKIKSKIQIKMVNKDKKHKLLKFKIKRNKNSKKI